MCVFTRKRTRVRVSHMCVSTRVYITVTCSSFHCRILEGRQGCDTLAPSGLDLALLADATQSLGRPNFRRLMDFVGKVIEMANVSPQRTRVGVITFHEDATVHDTFLDDRSGDMDKLVEMIEDLKSSSSLGDKTFIDRALISAEKNLFSAKGGDREGVPNVLVLFTDGKTNKRSKPYEEIIPRLRVSTVTSPEEMVVMVGGGGGCRGGRGEGERERRGGGGR